MLELLFNKYGCDKAKKHGYHKVYQSEFDGMRHLPINFLEIGVFKGHSLQAWLDFFPNATFYGVDTFQRIDPKDIEVLKNPRVKWARCDSTKTATRELIETIWSDTQFDVILDDGMHTPRANGQTFNVFYPLLKEQSGMYFIEDVWPLHIMNEEEFKHPWIKKYPERYNKVEMDYFMEQIPVSKTVEFDLREGSGEPDSYIMKIDK